MIDGHVGQQIDFARSDQFCSLDFSTTSSTVADFVDKKTIRLVALA